MLKGVSSDIPIVSILFLVCSTLPSLFFNNFQYISLYILYLQMLCFMIVLMLCLSLFFSLLPHVL
jgi:hypothetical protein